MAADIYEVRSASVCSVLTYLLSMDTNIGDVE